MSAFQDNTNNVAPIGKMVVTEDSIGRDTTEGFVKWLCGILEARGMPHVVAFELADLEAAQERDIDGKPTMMEIFEAGARWKEQQMAYLHKASGQQAA